MTSRRQVIAGAVGAALAQPASAKDGEYWPTAATWERVEAAKAGFDAVRLNAAVEAALADRSASVIVLRGGRLVAERYAPGLDPARPLEIASAGKSMVSVLVGVALDRGMIKSLDQSAAEFIPLWRGTPKSAITIRHMLSMTSGLDLTGLKDRGVSGDQFQINAAAAQRDAPGARWAYATPIYHLLFHVLARAAGEPFEAFGNRALLAPVGMTDSSWVTTPGIGADGSATSYYTARCTARDLARFGVMALRGGQWGAQRIVSSRYLREATSPSQDLNPAYGLLWWENARPGFAAGGDRTALGLRFPGSPSDTFAALGAGGQAVMVSPSLDVVVVRQGTNPATDAPVTGLMAGVTAALA